MAVVDQDVRKSPRLIDLTHPLVEAELRQARHDYFEATLAVELAEARWHAAVAHARTLGLVEGP
jgi:hypothetical protein